MTSIALNSKWFPESASVSRPSLRIDQVIDCSFKGYALSLRVPLPS